MSFLKKTLASFGIGSAKVDTVLQQNVLFPGQPVELKIFVYGGGTEQDIDNIDVDLCCQYVAEEAVERGSHGGDSMRTRRVKRLMFLATGNYLMPLLFILVRLESLMSVSKCHGIRRSLLGNRKFG
ncbi:hypothetical transcriptional regulator [Vibrio astriarenae]|nr:hypothetical transcriptional regulator [Vibrio sp. C7]